MLYGANSATYKFAFGATLLEIAATGRNHVTLEELAPRYAELLCQALQRQPRQGIAARSKFLDACRAFNAGELDRDALHRRTVQLGFNNVIDAFPQRSVPARHRCATTKTSARTPPPQASRCARNYSNSPDQYTPKSSTPKPLPVGGWETAWATGISDAVLALLAGLRP
ncbi:hypothetical protein [Sphaerisporangium perillae]|uniref:hypothetical protein n=1 Tax=Sphaerisporangium perillae TaxID=2935860 RepID=UPI00200C823F|nr:hypothetical protein [Sphaerisporangium perillae]